MKISFSKKPNVYLYQITVSKKVVLRGILMKKINNGSNMQIKIFLILILLFASIIIKAQAFQVSPCFGYYTLSDKVDFDKFSFVYDDNLYISEQEVNIKNHSYSLELSIDFSLIWKRHKFLFGAGIIGQTDSIATDYYNFQNSNNNNILSLYSLRSEASYDGYVLKYIYDYKFYCNDRYGIVSSVSLSAGLIYYYYKKPRISSSVFQKDNLEALSGYTDISIENYLENRFPINQQSKIISGIVCTFVSLIDIGCFVSYFPEPPNTINNKWGFYLTLSVNTFISKKFKPNLYEN